MKGTSEELPNFSIAIDFLGPDPTSNKNKAQKTRKLPIIRLFWTIKTLDNFGSLTFKTFFSDTWVHLALIFSIFPVNFELFIHSYRLTGSNVLAQTKV